MPAGLPETKFSVKYLQHAQQGMLRSKHEQQTTSS